MLKKLFIVAGVLFLTGAAAAQQTDDRARAVAEINKHFATVPTMSGEFIQFGPTGEQTGGEFYINRPGKIRFDYEDPSPIMVVSNGKTLGVRNKKLKTWSYFPLRKTPLSLLLSDRIKVTEKAIRSVDAGEDVTRVVMGDKALFGDSEITLMFDPKSYDLRQWSIKDAQGKETVVMLFNVQKNVQLSDKLFKIRKKAKAFDR